MKILFILDNYYPFKGGAETLFRNLAEGLVKKGNSVTVLTRKIKGARETEELNGVKVFRIGAINRYFYTFIAIPKAIELAKEADIIHTTTFNSAFPAWIAARIRKRPSVITIHEVWLGKWKEYTEMSRVNSAIHDLLETPIYKLGFDANICVSESTKKQLLKSCNWKKGEKTEVIYNGVDYAHFNPKRHNGEQVRKKLGLEKNFVCLTYGRAAPSKGMEYAARSIPLIKIPNLKFVFIIAKDYSKKYKQLIDIIKRTDSSKTLSLEPVPYSELPEYIATADCVVVPSISEGFGYAAAEASAMGKPVVASNTTSLPEVVSGKFVLAEPKNPRSIAEAIERVYNKKYSQSRLRKFTIEENVRRHVDLYSRLLSHKKA
ncbi:glycosyltransferase family 4 protein [Candidatus Woesearchaeota archaeon]|nr:glycosyltransferase family 4 protein [Candidatus Woesearchaeota archaeon]